MAAPVGCNSSFGYPPGMGGEPMMLVNEDYRLLPFDFGSALAVLLAGFFAACFADFFAECRGCNAFGRACRG